MIELEFATEGYALDDARALIREYTEGLGVDLAFQNLEEELASLPGDYMAPRGALILARVDGQAAGCCALRPLESGAYANAAEMKRLYVRNAFRGLGLGRRLAEAVLGAARQAGYACVLLDTLESMGSAQALYGTLGFEPVPPYYPNPIPGTRYMKAAL